MRNVDFGVKIVVRTLIRWFWLVLLCGIAGLLVGRVLMIMLPPMYQSTAIIQLNAQMRNSQSQIIQPIATYSTLITSDPVLNPVLKQYPKLDRQTFVAKNLVVITETSSQSLQVQVTLPDAVAAAKIANMLAQSLVTQQNAFIKTQYAKALQLINNHIAEEQKTINNLNQQYAATPQTNTALLSQLDSQLQQQRTLQNADIATQQSLLTEQTLYNNPLSVVLSATIASKPSSLLGQIPFIPLMTALFLLLALLVVGTLERYSGRVNGTDALQQKIALPLLGALCWTRVLRMLILSGKARKRESRYLEDCRVMTANVLFQAERTATRTIAITGLRSRAGTSSVAVQLATLLALSKRRVLLIDANLHQPTLHKLMRMPNDAGLVMMLEGEGNKIKVTETPSNNMLVNVIDTLPIDIFLKTTAIPDFCLLPAGRCRPNTNLADLLNIGKMRQLLDAATASVDFVIVDCPALNRGDARVLGMLCDQTLLVVDATRDRISQIVNIKHELANTGVNLSGLIVNKLGRWI